MVAEFLSHLHRKDIERVMSANPVDPDGLNTELISKGEAKRTAYILSPKFGDDLTRYLDNLGA